MSSGPRIAVKLISGGMAGLMKEFDPATEVLIGRGAGANVRLHPTEDKTAGREHARLFYRDRCWHIESIHKHGVMVRGERIGGPTPVQDGDIYTLGRKGPELRVSILRDAAPPTLADSATVSDRRMRPNDARRAATRPPVRRVEFDPLEVERSIEQASRRTMRNLLRVVLPLVGVVGLGLYICIPRGSPLAMTGAEILRTYRGSVLRAVNTVRFRCRHADVQQNDPARYWVGHGTSFVVGRKEDWLYALTNHHVFGESARQDLSSHKTRDQLVQKGILERWPRDWPKLADRLAEFDARWNAIDVTDAAGRTKVRAERYGYLQTIVRECEFDLDDDQWRQVIVAGRFVPVEIVESAADIDLVLFRFREPERLIEPLPLRSITLDDHAALSGQDVYVLGFPEAGDLPHKGSMEAMSSAPDIAPGALSNIKPDDLHGGYSIQVTAPINEGNSGGPLFDGFGNVIGINTWGPSKAEAEGVSYAVALGRATEMLKRHGVTQRKARLPD